MTHFRFSRYPGVPLLSGAALCVLAFSCSDEPQGDSSPNVTVTPMGGSDGFALDGANSQSSSGGMSMSSNTGGMGVTMMTGSGGMMMEDDRCMSDVECGEGQICQFSACRAAACTEDADCGPGRICDGGRCGVETCDAPLIDFTFAPTDSQTPDEVFLAGSMNSWSTAKSSTWALSKQSDGSWTGSFPVSPGQHSYKYQLYTAGHTDPEWVYDTGVDAWADDGFESRNSLIAVTCDGLELIEVECTEDTDCSGGEICGTIECVAPQCTIDDQCAGDDVCNAGRCAPPVCEEETQLFTLDFDNVPGGGMGGAGGATEVLLAGNFTGWQSGAINMVPGDDAWEAEVLLSGGGYEYKFIVDGTWIVDPDNGNTQNENSYVEFDCLQGMGGAGGMSSTP